MQASAQERRGYWIGFEAMDRGGGSYCHGHWHIYYHRSTDRGSCQTRRIGLVDSAFFLSIRRVCNSYSLPIGQLDRHRLVNYTQQGQKRSNHSLSVRCLGSEMRESTSRKGSTDKWNRPISIVRTHSDMFFHGSSHSRCS